VKKLPAKELPAKELPQPSQSLRQPARPMQPLPLFRGLHAALAFDHDFASKIFGHARSIKKGRRVIASLFKFSVGPEEHTLKTQDY
jgi:hypothetical protein